MKVSDAVARIKAAGHDISDEYTTEECLGFLNTATQELSHMLIAGKSPLMTKDILLHDNESVPVDCAAPCGNYPMRVTGSVVQFFDDAPANMHFRYFATKPQIADITDSMPFLYEPLNDLTVRTAVLFALNQNEYDITQDKALNDELRQMITAGMGG